MTAEHRKRSEPAMAGRDQRNEHRRQNGRLAPGVKTDVAQGTSRVSRAAGTIGSESMRVEQRSNPAATGQNSPRQAASKRTQSGKQATKRRTPAKQSAPAPTRDTRFIDWLRTGWENMEPHHQQRFLSVLLLLLSLLLFGALTLFRQAPILADLYKLSTAFFGWSAYLLALGLVAFALAHFVEGMFNKRLIRGSLMFWLVALWLLVLLESRLLLGLGKAGILADFLAIPLSGWTARNAIFIHVLLIGLCIIFVIAAFGIRFGHVLMIGRAIGKRGSPGGASTGTSPYLGQRPQYSRYGTGLSAPDSAKQAAAEVDEEDEDADSLIEFEDDFDGAANDPLNDINLHKDEIRLVPRGQRSAQSLNREEHSDAVQGAHQQQLPFNQDKAQMEPLAPNPMRNNQPVVITRAAGAQSQAALEPPWKLPDIKLLNNPEEVKLHMLGDDTTALAKIIQDTLHSFRVDADVKAEDISIGPTVIRFGIRPTGKMQMKLDAQGRSVPVKDASGNIVYESRTRVNRIMALQSDLALVLEAKSIRMEAPVPGRPYIGVEIPNKNSRLVTLREVLESKEYLAARAKSKLAVALGKDVAGTVRVGDLARMPHLLIAGATGSGKSVSINAIIGSILTQATPDDVRLLMVDPKMVELNMFNGIPHLLAPVVTEVEKVVAMLKIAIVEMEKRYRLFSQLGVRNLDGYRKQRAERIARGDTSLKNLPAIVIIIDELADLMMSAPEEIEGMICRLAQLARATGIHLVIATQRPSVDVITGLIKANIPTRISFMVSSAVD